MNRSRTLLIAVVFAMTLAILAVSPRAASADDGWWDQLPVQSQHAIVNSLYENTGHAPPFADALEEGHELATILEEDGSSEGQNPGAASRSGRRSAPSSVAADVSDSPVSRVDEHGGVDLQIEVYDDGHVLRYDTAHLEDTYGS